MKQFVLGLALLGALLVSPVATPVAQAGQVAKPDNSGEGYVPCSCICWVVLGYRVCACVCPAG